MLTTIVLNSKCLHTAIKNKHPRLLSKGLMILHDSALSHTANVSGGTLKKFKRDILKHPPYSPDLSPYDFRCIKEEAKGPQFCVE